jgi:hypothetical protein
MIKRLFMSLRNKATKSSKVEIKTQNEKEVTLKLTKGELEALLIGLGEATFKGRQVESVYKLVVKLQMEIEKLK